MSDTAIADSGVKVIRTAVLGFIDAMKYEKRMIEQQIRERSENIRSNLLNSGASQFNYQDVDNLSRQFNDEFLSIYRNTIHLKIISNASSRVKEAIEKGLLQAEIVQQEWLDGFNQLQEQINQYEDVAGKAEALQSQLEGTKAQQGSIEEFQNLIAEKDQIIALKDQEIMNLNEGLTRMENQANTMGQNMLENSMTIEELQEAINDRDLEIGRLKEQLTKSLSSVAEVEHLQQQLQEARDRERILQQQASTASTDLVSQLQTDLENTREQVLDLRKELVQKNEELYTRRIEQDEYQIKLKQAEDRFKEAKEQHLLEVSQKEKLSSEIDLLNTKNQDLAQEINLKEQEIEDYKNQIENTEAALQNIKQELESYEGKVALSVEEQERINLELEELKSKLADYKDTVAYISEILGQDVKYKSLVVLATQNDNLRLDDLANAVGVPENVVQRAVIELADQGIVATRREGRYLFCAPKVELRSPFALKTQ